MLGIGRRRKTRKILPKFTLGPGARAAFRAMNPERFGNIERGQIITLGPAARAYLRRKGVAVDRFPKKFRVVSKSD